MQSPPVEWTLGIGYLAALDAIRAHGEADNDTLSEVVRGIVRAHPRGPLLFTATLALGAAALHRHILKET